MLDHEKNPVRFHFQAPRWMQFIRLETAACPKTVVSMRNVLVYLDDGRYALPKVGVRNVPLYVNVHPPISSTDSSASSESSFSSVTTVIEAP